MKKTKDAAKLPVWVAVIVDESGSMSSCQQQTISGFNEFLQDRVKDSAEMEVRLWATKFNTSRSLYCSGEDPREVRPLSAKTYKPDGGTALYDAVAATVYSMESELSRHSFKEGQVPRLIVMIMTDGEENASKEITGETLKNIIKNREATDNWTFQYIGANVNAQLNSQKLGMTYGGLGTTNASIYSGMKAASNICASVAYAAPGCSTKKAREKIEVFVQNAGITLADELADVTIDSEGNVEAAKPSS